MRREIAGDGDVDSTIGDGIRSSFRFNGGAFIVRGEGQGDDGHAQSGRADGTDDLIEISGGVECR